MPFMCMLQMYVRIFNMHGPNNMYSVKSAAAVEYLQPDARGLALLTEAG